MGPWLFNSEKKLKRADADLSDGLFYDAMRAYKDILKKEKNNAWVRAQAEAGLVKARQGLVGLQTEEAKRLLKDGDRMEALECCRNAIELAGSDLRATEAKSILSTILPESSETADEALEEMVDLEAPTEDEDGAGATPPEIGKEDLFQLYLNSLPDEWAETLAGFGPAFRDGYLLVQQGRAEEGLERLAEAPDQVHPLFRFHKAQALFTCGRDKEALEALADLDLPDDLMRIRAELRTVLFWRLGEGEKSEKEARWLHEAAPDDMSAAHLYAQVLASNQKYGEALGLLKPWIHPAQIIPALDQMVIQLCLKLDEIDDATVLLERAVTKYFHDSLSSGCGSQVGRSFGLGARAFPSVEKVEPVEPYPLWAARKLLDLYIEHGEAPEKVEDLVETLIMYDPESELEYRERLNAYLDSGG
jgi:tetratricopeptide (TPR) repeat protein